MPFRLRLLSAAGAIVIVALLALSRLRPYARPEMALPATTARPVAPVSRIPPTPFVRSLAPELGEAERAALLRNGRFEELLGSTLDLDNEAEQARWLAACAQLAPPRLLAEHALQMPDGEPRDALLAIALERWVIDSPVESSRWAAAHLEDDEALDFALARFVEHTDAVQRPVASALALTGLIRDSALHLRALRAVVREWAGSDPAAALRFAETTPGLSQDERTALLALFVPPVTET